MAVSPKRRLEATPQKLSQRFLRSPPDIFLLSPFAIVVGLARRVSNVFSRSNSSAAITTTTGRSYFVTVTGAALARSMSSPKLFFASAEVMERIRSPFWEASVGRIGQQYNP